MGSVLLVDDHAVVRKGLRSILEEEFPSLQVDEAASGQECIEKLSRKSANAVVLDINLPDTNGLELLKRLKTEWPLMPVLILSIHGEDQYGVRMIRAGASGYLPKSSAPEKLVQALERLFLGERYISDDLANKLADTTQPQSEQELEQTLSDREFQIFKMIVAGKTVTAIAQEFSLSVKTVSTHRKHILDKMGVETNAELIGFARSRGLL